MSWRRAAGGGFRHFMGWMGSRGTGSGEDERTMVMLVNNPEEHSNSSYEESALPWQDFGGLNLGYIGLQVHKCRGGWYENEK